MASHEPETISDVVALRAKSFDDETAIIVHIPDYESMVEFAQAFAASAQKAVGEMMAAGHDLTEARATVIVDNFNAAEIDGVNLFHLIANNIAGEDASTSSYGELDDGGCNISMWRGGGDTLPVAAFIAAVSTDSKTLTPLSRPEDFGQDYGLAIVENPRAQDIESANYSMQFRSAQEMGGDQGFFIRITRRAGAAALPVSLKLIAG